MRAKRTPQTLAVISLICLPLAIFLGCEEQQTPASSVEVSNSSSNQQQAPSTTFAPPSGRMSVDTSTDFANGLRAAQEHDYEAARMAFTRVIETQPGNAKAYRFRGATYGMKGEHRQAIRDYTKAIDIDPRYGEAYGVRAISWYQLGDYAKATADLNRCQELGGYVDPAFATDLRNSVPSTVRGCIEIQSGRVVSSSSGKASEWQQQIVLNLQNGENYTVDPTPICQYDVPQSDQSGQNVTFQVGKDNQYEIKGYVSDYKTISPDGQSVLFEGKKIRAIEIKRLK